MSKSTAKETTITFIVKPTRPGCDVALMVRWVLKRMLRVFGFRCTRVNWTDGKPEGSEAAE